MNPIRHFLTRVGTYTVHPSVFLVVLVYACLWWVFEPETVDWHGGAALATWMMTLVIQRAEHRDTQAIHAKLHGFHNGGTAHHVGQPTPVNSSARRSCNGAIGITHSPALDEMCLKRAPTMTRQLPFGASRRSNHRLLYFMRRILQMFRHEKVLAATLSVLIVLASTMMSVAETVEILPSVPVTKHTYDVPFNEQPFYGFSPKNERMLAADRAFIDKVDGNTGREVGAEQFEAMGWDAVTRRDYSTAAKRFNQAWLLSPGRSAPVHGFAVLAAERFGDIGFAVELAEVAGRLRQPLPTLPGDHGGLLIRAGKPDQALPLLERAAAALPSWMNPQINLATAMFETGDVAAACRQLVEVERRLKDWPAGSSTAIGSIYQALSDKAQCKPL